jgi:hypothetical protein
MRRRYEFDGAQSRCNEYEAAPMLRNAVIGAIDNTLFFVFVEMKSFVGQRSKKVGENGIPLELRHIFHTDDVRPQFVDESRKLLQQAPFGVCFRVEALCVSREWLTGSATDKDANMILGVVTRERLAVEFANALSDETRAPIVVLVRMSTGVVGIIACNYRDSSVKQAAGKSTCSAEQINRCRH